MAKELTRQTDVNQRAKSIVDIAAGENKDTKLIASVKNVAAVELGRLEELKTSEFLLKDAPFNDIGIGYLFYL